MIPSETPIAVTLTAERWNQVLGVMDEAPIPHRITDPLMREIHTQCLAAGSRAAAAQQELDNVKQLRRQQQANPPPMSMPETSPEDAAHG
jgi:hypothetical protein